MSSLLQSRCYVESVRDLATLAPMLYSRRRLLQMGGTAAASVFQPEVSYAIETRDLYMFPRSDGILLGGTFERGVERLEPDLEAEKRIMAGQRAIFEGLKGNSATRSARPVLIQG